MTKREEKSTDRATSTRVASTKVTGRAFSFYSQIPLTLFLLCSLLFVLRLQFLSKQFVSACFTIRNKKKMLDVRLVNLSLKSYEKDIKTVYKFIQLTDIYWY